MYRHTDKIKQLIKEIKQQEDCNKKAASYYHQQCEDILHYIEHAHYTGAQGAKLLKALKNARIKRRFYKENGSILQAQRDKLTAIVDGYTAIENKVRAHKKWNNDASGVCRLAMQKGKFDINNLK